MQFNRTLMKCIRKEKGLSQLELAKISKIHHETISKIERGKKYPSWFTAIRIANSLDVSLDVLANRDYKEIFYLTKTKKEILKIVRKFSREDAKRIIELYNNNLENMLSLSKAIMKIDPKCLKCITNLLERSDVCYAKVHRFNNDSDPCNNPGKGSKKSTE